MINNDVNNQIKVNRLFGLCRYIAVVFGVILLSTWTVKSASIVNSTKQALQQNLYKEITGVVKTEQGDPIPGVTIRLIETNIETETNVDGRYYLNANEGDKIQFVFLGFKTTTITVYSGNILNITMIEDDTAMLFSIEISNCYPSVTSKENTCTFPNRNNLAQTLSVFPNLNIATETKAKTVTTTPRIECGYPPRRSFIHLLQGQMISLDFSKRYNQSERNPETILKDVENLTRNGNYTYVIDGVRVSEETFRSLNQNDVESVDVYKHTDVYNARFGNKENQSRISLNAR